MKRILLVFLVLIAVVAAALVYYNLGKPAPKAVDLLPQSTLILMHMPDFAQSRLDFKKTAAYALWHEPEVQAFLEKPRQALRDAFGKTAAAREQEKDGNATAELIMNAIRGEAFLAITHVTIIPNFHPGIIFGVDVKRKRVEAAAGLYKLEHNLKNAYPSARFETKKYLGVSYSLWQIHPNMPVCHAFLNSLLVFTLSENDMRDVIGRFTRHVETTSPVLATSANYQNVLQHVSKDYEFLAYINVEEVTKLLAPMIMMAPQSAGMFQKLGRIQATGNSVTFVGRGVQDVGFVAYTEQNPIASTPTPQKTFALTTPKTLFYTAGTADLKSSYDELMQSLTQSGNLSLTLGAAQFEQSVRNRGVRIREDLLANLGPEVAVTMAWRSGAQYPEIALVSELSNATTARPSVDTALDVLKEISLGTEEQFPWEVTSVAGHSLRTIRIGSGLVAPTYTTTDHFFILASTPDYARELLEQAKGGKPTLAANAEYERSMKQLPASGSSYTYCDLPSLVEPLYALLKQSLPDWGTNPYVDLDKLPHSQTITKHLFPFASVTVADPRSETTTSYSPLGRPFALIAAAAGGFWASQTFFPKPGQQTSQAWPRTFSDTDVHEAAHESQTAGSQIPAIE